MRTLKTREWVAVAVALVAAAILFFGGAIWKTLKGTITPAGQTPTTQIDVNASTTGSTTESSSETATITTMQNTSKTPGLEIYDEKVGTGAEAKAGQTIQAHYVGTLVNGTKFDSSVDRGQPFEFTLGVGQVIQGWDLGIQGMKVGGTRRLVISPDLGYGARGAGNLIPPNSTLVFEVQLIAVK
ncbi:MAG: FKBP-type peptidyl-prolyl cis-trans isomerase [Candidatus Paceibacterota bacterium]|jgi:FKBP-type peptidyl-prolyl cis-trans isomerase